MQSSVPSTLGHPSTKTVQQCSRTRRLMHACHAVRGARGTPQGQRRAQSAAGRYGTDRPPRQRRQQDDWEPVPGPPGPAVERSGQQARPGSREGGSESVGFSGRTQQQRWPPVARGPAAAPSPTRAPRQQDSFRSAQWDDEDKQDQPEEEEEDDDRGEERERRGGRGGGSGGGGQRWTGMERGYGRWENSYGAEQEEEEDRRPTIRDELVGEVLFGVYPVLNALKAGRRELHALYVLSSLDMAKRKDAAALREVFRLAKELDIVLHKVDRHDLNLLSDDKLHQGLILDCSALQWSSLDTFPTAADVAAAVASAAASSGAVPAVAAPPVWLALDEVMDPQNFGAVVRSAHCLGASGILACSRNCAPLSATVSKASAGVLEVTTVHSCQNMVRTLQQAVADGWQVLGATADPQALECRKMRVDRPTILVVGNEGAGLRTNIRRACSGFVKVEMGLPRQQLAADSLNVSVAAGILMHAALGSALSLSAAVAQPMAESQPVAAE